MVKEFEQERAMLTEEERASDDDGSDRDIDRAIDGDMDGAIDGCIDGDVAPAAAAERVAGDEQADAKKWMQQQLLVFEVRLRGG